MNKVFSIIVIAAILLSSCQNKTSSSEADAIESIEASNTVNFNPVDYKEEDIVFYNLFSPVDLSYLVTKDVSFYNSSLLNPLNNITKYNNSYKAALNLGVYGADLSYLWLFNQSQQAHSYLTAIQELSDQLGIPREFVDFTYQNAQTNSSNIDTLIDIARKSYYDAENHLKETDRDYAASLILLGGWIETMYIAINMYENPNQPIISRLAAQKFSSNSLYRLLMNSQNEASVGEYLLLIKRLNKLYDELNIEYPEGSLVIDTFKRRIQVSNEAKINLTEAEIKEIRELTDQIRAYIIE